MEFVVKRRITLGGDETMAGYTISVSQGNHAEEHSRRSYTPMSADKSLEQDNIVIYDCGDDKEHFNDFFRSSIEEYNSRQKRADRKKSLDYYDALLRGTEGYGKGKQQEKPIYHEVIQIGNRDTNGVTDDSFDVEHWRQLKREGKFHEASSYVKQHKNETKETRDFKEILTELTREIKENKDGKYDGMLIHGLIIHADEPNGTIHLDMRYTMYTDEGNTKRKNGHNNGVATRVSMNKCLGKLGFKTNKQQTALEQFRESLKDRLEEKMAERGYEREIKGEHRAHMPNAVYEAHQELKKTEAKTKTLQKKAAGLEEKVSEVERRESKVADDEAEIRRKRSNQNERERDLLERTRDLEGKEQRFNEDQYKVADLMFLILDRIHPESSERNYRSLEELHDEVEYQLEIWDDAAARLEEEKTAVKSREKSVSEKEAKVDNMMEHLQRVPDAKPNPMVIMTEKTKDGHDVPKVMRDEKGTILRDKNGKPMREPARPLREVVAEMNEQFDRLTRMRSELETSSADRSLER